MIRVYFLSFMLRFSPYVVQSLWGARGRLNHAPGPLQSSALSLSIRHRMLRPQSVHWLTCV